MTIRDIIHKKLLSAFAPIHLDIQNESGKHTVPANSESHFRVVIVSKKFQGQNFLDRHRDVNTILEAEFKNGIHALALNTLTPDEWRDRNETIQASPPCLGSRPFDQEE